jgi:NADPH-dependent curcumin reductase CurA
MKSREIRLKKRPEGLPSLDNFELAEIELPALRLGEMLIRNVVTSVDPYLRGRMSDRDSYAPPFKLGAAIEGRAVGEVVASNGGCFTPGTYVIHRLGWRDYALSAGAGLTEVDPKLAPLSAYLGTLGASGLTAYVGLLHIAEAKMGETVFVSAAAGAVGTVVCQIAKAIGCTVIGSAGSQEKVDWLLAEAGCDHAINYKTAGDLTEALAAAAPNGIDVYFENVGGEHLVAALNSLKPFGRVAVCGMIGTYNATTPQPGPWNLFHMIPKRLTIKGFALFDHDDLTPQFMKDMSRWIADGKLKLYETVVDGLEKAPDAFIGIFKGENIGKMIVRIGPDKS